MNQDKQGQDPFLPAIPIVDSRGVNQGGLCLLRSCLHNRLGYDDFAEVGVEGHPEEIFFREISFRVATLGVQLVPLSHNTVYGVAPEVGKEHLPVEPILLRKTSQGVAEHSVQVASVGTAFGVKLHEGDKSRGVAQEAKVFLGVFKAILDSFSFRRQGIGNLGNGKGLDGPGRNKKAERAEDQKRDQTDGEEGTNQFTANAQTGHKSANMHIKLIAETPGNVKDRGPQPSLASRRWFAMPPPNAMRRQPWDREN